MPIFSGNVAFSQGTSPNYKGQSKERVQTIDVNYNIVYVDLTEVEIYQKLKQGIPVAREAGEEEGFWADTLCYYDHRSDDQMDRWPPYGIGNLDLNWYLKNDYSGLFEAFNQVNNSKDSINFDKVKIAHIDTGYDPNHGIFTNLNVLDKNNYLKDGGPNNVVDLEGPRGDFQKMNFGHGSGTLAILAGGEYTTRSGTYRIGGNPRANVLIYKATYGSPLNFQNTVGNVVKAINNAVSQGCDIISLSHGGRELLPLMRLKRAVRNAYENGVVVVAAAGNNFRGGGLKNIESAIGAKIVSPAKFESYVIAVGAATHENRPYAFEFYPDVPDKDNECSMQHMQMSWQGRKGIPENLIAAYSPNLPFVKFNTQEFRYSGGGTSGAVPQVSAAISLYLTKFKKTIETLSQGNPQKKVDIIKWALFESAKPNEPHLGIEQKLYKKYFGNGRLDALNMLNFDPIDYQSPTFPIIDEIESRDMVDVFYNIESLFPWLVYENRSQLKQGENNPFFVESYELELAYLESVLEDLYRFNDTYRNRYNQYIEFKTEYLENNLFTSLSRREVIDYLLYGEILQSQSGERIAYLSGLNAFYGFD